MTNNLSKLQKFGRFAKPTSIIILASLTILSIYLTPKLFAIKTQYSLDQFQPTTSHILSEDDNIKDTFKTHGQLPIIADLKIKKNGHWLSPDRLKTLAFISKEIKRIDGVEKTTSLTTVDTAIPDQGSFYVGSILDLSMNNQERQQVLQNPFLVPHLLSKDGKNVSLLIELKRLSFDQQQITIKKIQETLIKRATFFDANIGGPAAITATMTDMVSKEVITSTLASLLISILFFFVLFKNPSVLMASALIVLYSNIIGLGMLWLFDLKLTVLTSTLPSIITLTVVAIAVQTFSRVALFRHKVIEKHKHIMTIKIISGVIGSSFLASVTTAIGFATLITSDTPIMREYGLSVSIAVIVASITCLLVLSALLVWMPVPHKRKLSFPVHKFFSYFFVYQKPFLATIAALCVCFMFLGSNLNWSARLFDDLPQEAKAIQATKAMESTFGGVLPMDVMITAPTVDYWKQHYNISRLDQLKREFSKKEGIGSIVTLSDFFKLSSMNGRLPASHSALSENYFVYAMAQDNPLDQFVTLDYKSTRLSLKLHDIPADQNDALVSAFVERAKTMFPDTTVTKGGIAATVHTLNKSLSLELILGAFAALLAIFVLLVIIFRSVRWSLVAMIPNLMAPLALLGALGLTNTPIKPSLAIVFAISLGISFDNTIYVLMKLRKLVAQKGNTVRLPILGLMREELVPCLVSSSAIITGFSVFLFSNFSINKTFGIFMILSLTAGLIGDLVLLPVLLHYAPGLLLKPINIAKLQERLGAWTMKPTTQRYIIVFAIFTACAMLSQPAFAAKTANGTELLKQIAYKNATPSEEAKIRMKIKESDGSSKERVLIIKKKVKKDQMALVRLLSPNDLKGVGLLTVNKGNNENQWLYLPSEKRSRRIVGSNRNGRFLDSEISYEDMRISTYENFHNKVTDDPKGNQDIVLIESTVKNKKDSSYGKIKTWVDTKQERLLKTEYYTPEGELLKVMTFANYKKYDKVWRAQTVQVKNVQKNRSTVLEIEKFSTKNISDDEFSIDTLEEG